MEARLVVVGGKANKSEVRLKLPAMIGRSRDADVTVSHASVSRHHCLIYELEGALVVRDNGSLNGTVVDGQKVQEALLKPGQSLTIGPLTFRAEYEHAGRFPSVGAAPAGANGQAYGAGLPLVAQAEAPPADEEEAGAGELNSLSDEPAEQAGAASEPSFNFLAGGNSEESADEEQTPAVAAAEQSPDAGEGTIQMQAPGAVDSLPDVHLGSDAAADESASGGFGFLNEEPDEPATTSSKPSFGFLAGGDSGEPAEDDDSGAIFRFADDSPQPASSKDKSPAAAGNDHTAKIVAAPNVATKAAQVPAAEAEDSTSDDAALNDFLNSLGLEE